MEAPTPRAYGYRWIVLLAFVLIAGMSQVLWISFAPVTSAAAAFYHTSDLVIGLLSMSFMIVYVLMFLPAAWAILRGAGTALERRGAGTLIQVSGGSARRAMPGRGPWAAAQFAARALTHALALELRPQGVHVALLVADGVIETDREPMAGRPPEESLVPADVAAAVAYLAGQSPRGWTHELVITPAADTWIP